MRSFIFRPPVANGGSCPRTSHRIRRYKVIFMHGRAVEFFASLNYTLVMAAREAAGREASPTAGVIDSQSVKTTESGGPRGFDAGKKIKGRKRPIATDTQGNLVGLVV